MEPQLQVQEQLRSALKHLVQAVDILDRSGAPAHIAAHVDLAIHQIRELLGSSASQLN